jgi:hypothetical protein
MTPFNHFRKLHKQNLEPGCFDGFEVPILVSPTDQRLHNFYNQPTIAKIVGLPIKTNGYRCSSCNKVYSTSKTIRQHECQQFQVASVPVFQSLFAGVNLKYFAVTEQSSSNEANRSSHSTKYLTHQDISKLVVEKIAPSIYPSSLMSKLRWEAYFTEEFSKQNARVLMNGEVKNTRLECDKSRLFTWLGTITEQIKRENRQYLLQQIEGNIKGFRTLQNEKSIKIYSNTMFCILQFLYKAVICGAAVGFTAVDEVDVNFLDYWEGNGSTESLTILIGKVLFTTKQLVDERKSFFISNMVAFMGLNSEYQWKSPNTLRQPISHLIYWQKTFVYNEIVNNHNADALNLLDITLNSSYRVLVDYAAILKQNVIESPDITYINWKVGLFNRMDYTRIVIRGQEMPLILFKVVYHDYLKRLEAALAKLMGDFLPLKQFPSIIDDLGESSPGYSFLVDGRNSIISSESARFSCNVLAATTAKTGWLKTCNEFIANAIFLIHLSSGQPARHSELVESQSLFNTIGGIRNVYWYQNRVMLVQRYSKTDNLMGRNKETMRHCHYNLDSYLLNYQNFYCFTWFMCDQLLSVEKPKC